MSHVSSHVCSSRVIGRQCDGSVLSELAETPVHTHSAQAYPASSLMKTIARFERETRRFRTRREKTVSTKTHSSHICHTRIVSQDVTRAQVVADRAHAHLFSTMAHTPTPPHAPALPVFPICGTLTQTQTTPTPSPNTSLVDSLRECILLNCVLIWTVHHSRTCSS